MATIMRDSVNPFNIPVDTPIVAGYVDGIWRWSDNGWARFANTRKRRIAAVTVTTRSDSADVENQDLTPADVPIWHRNMTALGETDLWVYVNRSNGKAVEAALRGAGIGSDQVKLWVATLDGSQVVSTWIDGSPITYPVAAVQYVDTGAYDESVVYETFGGGSGTIPEDEMLYLGPTHPLQASLKAYVAGSYYSEPFASKPAGDVTVGAVYPVDGYVYSSSSVQATIPPESDFLWWHVKTGDWVPDALLDTSALAGAPPAAWPAAETVSALYDSATGRYIPLVGTPPPTDDDSAFVTKAALKTAIGGL